MTFNRLAQETAKKDSISRKKALIKNLANIKETLLEDMSYQVSVRNHNAVELYQE